MRSVTTVAGDLFCPECGYSLRGIDDVDRCPECGHALDRARLVASNIPWTHRHDIGAIRAYWRTVWLVLRHPSRAAADVARPVSFDDAQTFRRATVLLAMIGPLALLTWLVVEVVTGRPIAMSSTTLPAVRVGWLLEILLVPVIIVAFYAFLLAASGVASYFFHPKYLPIERQNRAVALSYYAAAPMALTTISVMTMSLALLALELFSGNAIVSGVLLGLGAAVPVIQVLASIVAPLRMMQRTTHCSVGRVIFAALALPILWALLAAIVAIGIPAAYVFVAAVIMSLVA